MLPPWLIDKINSAYTIIYDMQPCENCGSVMQLMCYDKTDGQPTVEAICFHCGKRRMIQRYKYEYIGEREPGKKDGEWRDAVFMLHGKNCFICGSDMNVVPHHIIPVSHDTARQFRYYPRNGIPLCRRCHELVHGEWMKRYRPKEGEEE